MSAKTAGARLIASRALADPNVVCGRP